MGDITLPRRIGRRRRPTSGPQNRTGQSAWQQPRYHMPPLEVLSRDQVEAVHLASMKILRDVGVEIVDDRARQAYIDAGAEQGDGPDRIRFDPEMVEAFIGMAPDRFTLHARNPAHSVEFGGDRVIYTSVASAPHCSDLDGGRRTGNLADFRNLVKLTQSFNVVHVNAGYPVEPVDVHASIRHLVCLSEIAKLTDKAFHAYSLGLERNLDALEIVRIARGISDEQLDSEASLFTIINSNSPLKFDGPMLTGIMEMSRRNQVVVLTPFTLAGAMAPVTLAGALAQQNAEVLAGLVLAQSVRPGSPFVYGGFTSNVDMRSGAPAFGTPEYMKAALAGGQLARRYRLPYRSSNVNAANAVDSQAAWESVFALWGALNGHVNLLMHGAGWLEGGLCASFEKFVVDCDLLQMVTEYLKPMVVDDDEFGLDAILEAGPGGHFFGTGHTQARYKTAFYEPLLSDWRNFESWSESGSPKAVDHANRVFKKVLDEYEAPPMDPAIAEELDAFTARRTAEGGAPTDF